jgi:RNA polymerase sigma-70 factor (ECF subfamily)
MAQDAQLTDSELIAKAKEDTEAFGLLYERYVDRIYKYIYYRTGNVADAEDLTARVFMRAMQHIGRYQDKGVPFSAWLYRIARNLVANWHRDQSRRRMISIDDIMHWRVTDDSPEIMAQFFEDRDSLLVAVRKLPSDRQELLVLKFVDRLSNAEIGAVMDRSEGAIKSLYHRTLISLRDDFGDSNAGEQRKPRIRLPRFRNNPSQ